MLSKGSYLIEEKLLKGSYQREVVEGELSKQSFTRQPNPEGVIYGNFPHRVAHPLKIIYEHLWLIDGHF